MYNFLFHFLFSSSSPVISLFLLVFFYLSTSSFAAAAKASPSNSPSSLSLFFSHTSLQPNKLATMPPARRDQNANTNASNPESTATIQVPSTMTPEQTDLIFKLTRRTLEEDNITEPLLYDDPPASYLSSTPRSVIIKHFAWYGLAPDTRKSYAAAINSYVSFCASAQQKSLASPNDNARGMGSDSYLRKHTAKVRPDKAGRGLELPLGPQIVPHRYAHEPWGFWRPTDGTHHQRQKKTIPQQEAKSPPNYKKHSWENHGGEASFNHGSEGG